MQGLKIFVLFVVVCFPSAYCVGATGNNEPLSYYNGITSTCNGFLAKTFQYYKETERKTTKEQLLKNIAEVQTELKTAKATLANMQPINESDSLLITAIAVLATAETAFFEAYPAATNIIFQLEEKDTTKQYLFDLLHAEKTLSEALTQYNNHQKRFIQQHNINHKASKQPEDITLIQILQVNIYCHQLKLLLVDIPKINETYLSALNEKKVDLMEVSRQELEDVVRENLASLLLLKAYADEKIFYDKVKEYLEYYARIAENEYNTLYQIRTSRNRTLASDVQRYNDIIYSCNQKVHQLEALVKDAESKFRKKYLPKL